MRFGFKMFLLLVTVFLIEGCVEPYEFETLTFDSALAVEGTITNEEKRQEISITRTYPIEENGPVAESGATVRVLEDDLEVHVFFEQSPGRYVSENSFSAEVGKTYRLEIEAGDGRLYTSAPESISGRNQIENLSAVATENSLETPGVAILVNGSGTAGYYRYEYEETYKIVSPFFKSLDIILNENENVQLVPKSKEEYTCFRSSNSSSIILGNSNNLSEDRINEKVIRFIPRDDPILGQRYSILVKQYSISREAYVFYETLKELSESESLFSQTQPGYLAGNVFSVDNEDERVLGFFNVSWVTQERLYFNYTDFFSLSDGPRPSFITYCPLEIAGTVQELINYIRSRHLRFHEDLSQEFNEGSQPDTLNPARYVFVRAECVDCTIIGSNDVPGFWED